MSKHLFHIALLLCFALGVNAQDAKPLGRIKCAVTPDGAGIAVKIIARAGYFPGGVDVFRQEGSGDWVKLNDTPLKYNESAPESRFANAEEYKMFRAIRSVDYATFDASMVKALAVIKVVQHNGFAEALGVYYIDRTAQSGATYQYKAVGNTGSEEQTLELSDPITMGAYSAPAPPDSVVFERTKKQIKIGWKPDVNRYYAVNIFRKEGNGEFVSMTPGGFPVNPKKDGTFDAFLLVDDQIEKDKDYTYKLTAIDYLANEGTEAALIEAKAVDLDPPALPLDLHPGHMGADNKIYLEWTLSEDNDATTAAIYLRNSAREEKQQIASGLDPRAGRFEHNIPGQGSYYLTLELSDAAGNTTTAPEAIVTLDDMVPPPAPSGFKAKADSGRVEFSWNAVESDDFTGYFLYRTTPAKDYGQSRWIALNTTPLTETTYTLELGLNVREASAYYIASADDNYNHSAPANVQVVQLPDVIAPAQPIIKSIAIAEGDTNKQLVIEWLANADSDLKGYMLYKREKGSEDEPEQANFNLLPPSSTRYTDRLAEAGVRYEYTLQAVDSSGLKSLVSPGFVGGLPKEAEDIAPQKLSVRAIQKKKSSIVSWEDGPDKDALLGYTVFRGESGQGLKPVSGLTKGTQFKDAGLEEGKTYTYEVRAYSITGFEVKSTQENISIKSNSQ